MKHHAAVMLAALSVVGAAARAQPVPTTDVPALRATLYDDSAKPEQREQAAQRLLARPDPAAREALSVALTESGRPAVQLAAAKALADRPTADPALITPLFALMEPGSNDILLDAVSRALSAYKNDAGVLSRLIKLATTGSEGVRLAAIRAVGTFIEKPAAAALVPLVEPGQLPRVTIAASSALAYLSGLDASTDAAGWLAWWEQNRNKPDVAFAADLARTRAARYDVIRTREEKLQDELFRFLSDQYQRASREERGQQLLRLMTMSQASMRAVGCRIARTAAENDVTPMAVKEQLRQLIGDASPDVRRRAAAALSLINDAEAVVPILTQLNQETDSSVRAAFADALRPTRDPRAAAAMLIMLDDSSLETAQAAAVSLSEIGPPLRSANPTEADSAAQRIMAVLSARTKPLQNIEFRNALIQAATPLQSRAIASQLQRLLAAQGGEDRRVRRSLLAALGRYKNSDYVGDILPLLRDKNDPLTRLAAIRALGECADNFSAVQDTLGKLATGADEPQDVRDAAWKVLSGLFKNAPAEQLSAWESRLASDPARLSLVLVEQRNRAIRDGKPDKAAERNQQLGEAYANDGVGRWADAVEAYRAAITTRLATNPNQPIELLSEGMAKALLRARQYPQATEFIQQRLRESPAYQTRLGQILRKEVGRLIDEARDYDAATDLIDRALKISNPPLTEMTRSDLLERQAKVQGRDRPRNSVPNLEEHPILTAMR